MYMSNNVKPQLHTPRPPVTSSPRTSEYQEVDFDNERKHKRRRRKKQKKPAVMDTSLPTENGQVPKALSPMPQRIKSIPPSEVHIRPSSALERPRDHVSVLLYLSYSLIQINAIRMGLFIIFIQPSNYQVSKSIVYEIKFNDIAVM